MSTELQLKKVPAIVKSLITREASIHRRSINQEAVLLEEALLARANRQQPSRDEIEEILNRFDKLPTPDSRPMSEIIEYDELGLPK
jgi:hypothetical protein